MRFEWDEQKRKANIRKHGFDFRDAWKVFQLPMLVALVVLPTVPYPDVRPW
ncbi:MAG TPA: hypothetical protein ENJ02_05445 [Chloroflexi bacterium]|nr:hypothetical protein [Chloroflexota bacterium]